MCTLILDHMHSQICRRNLSQAHAKNLLWNIDVPIDIHSTNSCCKWHRQWVELIHEPKY